MIPTREQIGMLGNTGNQILAALGVGESGDTPAGVTIPEALEEIAFAIKTLQDVQVVTEKDVNFIDYDGTLIAGYTAGEFALLTELPGNPKHEGLTAQGWNWTLEDAKEYVAAHGKLYIGQCYVTSNGTTRLHIDVYHRLVKRLKLGLAVDGTVEIDWGDGSEKSTLTGTSTAMSAYLNTEVHEYPATGKYTIEIKVTEGSAVISSQQSTKTLLTAPDTATNSSNRIFCNMLYGMEIGSNMTVKSTHLCDRLRTVIIPPDPDCITGGAFNGRKEIKTIIIPSGFTEIAQGDFSYMTVLEYVSLPKSILTIGNDAFRGTGLQKFIMPPNVASLGLGVFQTCEELEEIYLPPSVTSISSYLLYMVSNMETITLPENLTSIGEGAFQYDSGLIEITIPSGVTTIGQSAFAGCISLREIHFLPDTPPTAGANAFQNLQTYCKIYVPAGSLSTYTSAENYPDSNTYTYIEE